MLPAGYLSRAFMKDWELTRAEQVVDRIHTNHFLSVPDHQLNDTQREKFVSQPWMAFLIQKMIFQQSSIRAALDEPQAPPLADATI